MQEADNGKILEKDRMEKEKCKMMIGGMQKDESNQT